MSIFFCPINGAGVGFEILSPEAVAAGFDNSSWGVAIDLLFLRILFIRNA